jgi:type II secretory pathway component GspD/PulD (secretin)
VSAEVQYVDVGLTIQAMPESSAEGLRLESRIEQSSLAGERATGGAPDPMMKQTVLDTTASLEEGKQQVLGSLDVPGTAKRLEVSVVAEAVK